MVELSLWPVLQPCLLTFFITVKNLEKKKQNQSPKMSEENGEKKNSKKNVAGTDRLDSNGGYRP